MSAMQHFREYRCMPFVKRGMKVKFEDRPGVIVAPSSGMRLKIRFDDGKTGSCHPYYRMTYLDGQGNVIKSYGD